MSHILDLDEYPTRNRFRFCPLCATELVRVEVFERERLRCPSCGWIWFPNPNVAATMVIEHEGGIVLLRRAIPPDVGIWHLPIGHAEYGEHPADAALREAHEETGLELADPVFLSWEHSPSYQDPTLFYVVFGFTARVVGGVLRHDPMEASELAIVPLDALPPLKWTSQQRAVEAYRNAQSAERRTQN
ncbi:MAG: NUDIX hydrolase [Chloroflexales bacterium]|nr:NUDIX hydrolase [Chloroflexales bacterium]